MTEERDKPKRPPKLELVSDRVLAFEWESIPRLEPRRPRDRLGPITARHTSAETQGRQKTEE
jgi:hypothetical protein